MKGEPGRRIEKSSNDLLPHNILCCCQRNAWMDKSSMRIWRETVFESYIAKNNGESGLILDNYVSHRNTELIGLVQVENTIPILIPPQCTSFLQSSNVGIDMY